MKLIDNTLILNDFIANKSFPKDDSYDNHVWFTKTNKLKGTFVSQFDSTVDHFVSISNNKKRGPKQLKDFRRHWEILLRSLSSSLLHRKWLVVPMTKGWYSSTNGKPWLKDYSQTIISEILHFMADNDLIELREGKKYKDSPKATRLFPKEALAIEIITFGLYVEKPFRGPYVKIKDPEKEWSYIDKRPDDLQEAKELKKINDFLKKHSWACKGPITRNYKHDIFHSGRLITPFQNLPQTSYPLRINTLLDGKPIAEVDFSSNHLRLQLAVLHGTTAPEDPYTEIGALSGDLERYWIKKFITAAMGASSQQKGRGALYGLGFNEKLILKVEQATHQLYPDLVLYDGWGLNAQSLEGDVLKGVLLDGVDAGIVCLPVHDAIAVQQENVEWAKERMLHHWAEVTGGFKTYVSVTCSEDCRPPGLSGAAENGVF